MRTFPQLRVLLFIGLCLIMTFCDDQKEELIFPEPHTCPGVSEVFYGGITYPTVQIGEQCWLAKNLNIGTMISHTEEMSKNNKIEKYCFQDDTVNCFIYGAYYQWDELMKYESTEGSKGICPEGWHVPTNKEIAELIIYIGGNTFYLSWELSNGTGFNSLPSGSVLASTHEFTGIYYNGFYWSSKEISEVESIQYNIGYPGINFQTYFSDKRDANSVRCIKNIENKTK